jgi:hypothetical protein
VTDQLLVGAIAELVPPPTGAFGDWNDVLRRAGIETRLAAPGRIVPPRHRRVARRHVVVGLLVVAVLCALLATPAFGIRGFLLGLVGRTDVSFTGKKAPYEVRREFFDLSLGAPPQMAPQAIETQARRVGVFHVFGRAHVLYVAPTRRGGFCFMFAGGFGGCSPTRSGRPLSVGWTGSPFTPLSGKREPDHVMDVGGEVLSAKARTIQVEYEDGSKEPIPFVFVSKPIDAGFFYFGIPAGHAQPGTRARALAVLDARGNVIARERYPYVRRRVFTEILGPAHRPIVHSPKLPSPSPPVQVGSDGGVSVRAGRNGVAIFDTTGATTSVARLIRGNGLGYVCFSFMRYHEDAPAELGFLRSTLPRVAIRPFGIPTPFDGCEIQGSYGHVWPDRNGSHSAVEIAFDARARRFFADRAAARDLALLVRSRTVQRLRKLPPRAAVAAIRRRYGDTGRIRVFADRGTLVFAERSPTGRRFSVVVRDGRIVRENVKPFTGVF